MRQWVGEKKLRRLRAKLNLDIEGALVRGGTGHRVDLCLRDGSIMHYWPRTQELQALGGRWKGARA